MLKFLSKGGYGNWLKNGLNPLFRKKMKVKLAAQVLCHHVAAAIIMKAVSTGKTLIF